MSRRKKTKKKLSINEKYKNYPKDKRIELTRLEKLKELKRFHDNPFNYFSVVDYHNAGLPRKRSKNKVLRYLQDKKAVFDPL